MLQRDKPLGERPAHAAGGAGQPPERVGWHLAASDVAPALHPAPYRQQTDGEGVKMRVWF
jgi:hypothetical protein